jgi:hypothetical protein
MLSLEKRNSRLFSGKGEKKKEGVAFLLEGYFFLSSSKPTMAIAINSTIPMAMIVNVGSTGCGYSIGGVAAGAESTTKLDSVYDGQ